MGTRRASLAQRGWIMKVVSCHDLMRMLTMCAEFYFMPFFMPSWSDTLGTM